MDYPDNIIVNRRGNSLDSHMQTVKVIGNIIPNETYTIKSNSLYTCSKAGNINKPTQQLFTTNTLNKSPPCAKIKNNWNSMRTTDTANSNILGTSGEFQINSDLVIPIVDTTDEYLGFYGCKLIKQHDCITIDSPKKVPITMMQIGQNYAKDYLLTEMGGGCYLEYHDVPHIHIPQNSNSGGFLILGKIIDDNCCLSAFKIPYLHGIYTAPFVIHCDAFLVGDYIVAYTVTENYSTVLLKNNNSIVDVRFTDSI